MVGPTAIQPHPPGPNAVPIPPVAKTASPKPIQAHPQPTTSALTDTLQISSAAQMALQEAMETQAQTIKEASTGDRQAQRLLAKEVAARKVQQ